MIHPLCLTWSPPVSTVVTVLRDGPVLTGCANSQTQEPRAQAGVLLVAAVRGTTLILAAVQEAARVVL
jgi:hypothetical protein